MKNTQLYPFERNKYYYGMLLSVEDFNAEQKYMNDKRRLINRLIHGSGVVCGLNVVRIDEQTISVESGLAIDSTGREIIVDLPVTKKISDIKGYDRTTSGGDCRYIYLCLEYKEVEGGAGHSIADDNDNGTYDRIREGYSLYLIDEEPENGTGDPGELYEERTTVFWDGNLKITHVIPKYARSMSEVEFMIEVENFSKQFVSFSYDIQLVCLNTVEDDSSVLRVKFNEMLYDKTGRYSLTYKLKSNNVSDTEGTATIDAMTFSLTYDSMPANGTIAGRSETYIISGDIKEAIVRGMYDRNMDTFLREAMPRRLYLARLNVINAGGRLIIESVRNVPFGQYVVGNPMLKALCDIDVGSDKFGSENANTDNAVVLRQNTVDNKEIASGICRINLSDGSLKNAIYYSDEIVHTLGLGSVTIILGTPGKEGSTVYGDTSIFPGETLDIDLAARLDPKRGSFIIGIKPRSTIVVDYVDVKWTVIRDVSEKISEQKDMKIMIKPNSLVIKPRENRYLEAICFNMTNKTVRWSVVSPGGGEIDSNGLYTAPNTEGVYEVMAQSAVYDEVKASIMVVVRE